MDAQKFLQGNGSALIQQLTTKLGFAQPAAQSFLSQLAAKVVDLLKRGGGDLKSLLGAADAGALISKLGLGQIAKSVGIDEAKATAGARAVLPGLLEGLQKQAGGLGATLGNVAGGAGDLLKKAGGMFGQS